MSLIRKNIFWLLVSQAATWIATLVALVFVPNSLGSTDFGTYGFATGFVQFFTLFAGMGTSIYVSRAIARDHSLFGRYVWNASLLKIGLWLVCSAAAMGIALLLGNHGETLALIAINCLGMLPFLLTEVFTGALAGIQQMARPAMWVVAQVYFQTVFGILVLVLGWGVVAYTIVMTLGILIPATATGLLALPFVRGQRTFDLHVWRLLLVGGIPLLALTFLNLIYGTVDVPILHSLTGSDPVGWYIVAMKWVSIPAFITTAVVAAYFPAFSRHGHPISEEFAPLVNRSIHLVLVVTIPASVGLFFVADEIIRLMYEDSYEPSVVLIRILAIGIPIMAMDTILGTALVASDRLNRYLPVAAAAAVLNPLLCVAAVKITDSRWDNGAIGTSIATVATELFVMGGALWLKAPGVMDRQALGRLVRVLLASAAMVPALALTANLHISVQIGVGMAVFAAAALACGAVSIDEVRDLIQQFTSRRKGEAQPLPEGDAETTPDRDVADDDGVGASDTTLTDGR